jgi:hypothetical protein
MNYDPLNKVTLIDLWLKRDESKRRTETDILIFHTEIQKNSPNLLRFSDMELDTYQQLKLFLPLSGS